MPGQTSSVSWEFFRRLTWALLFATLFMTYLTCVKENGLYYDQWHNWQALVYRFGVRAYYPLLSINLMSLLLMAWLHLVRRRKSAVLALALVIFAINVCLFSANNVINFIQGVPLHRSHKGIGW